MTSTQDLLLTRKEAAERAGVNIRTIDRWMKIEILPKTYTLTKRVRVKASDVDRIVRAEHAA